MKIRKMRKWSDISEYNNWIIEIMKYGEIWLTLAPLA